MTSLHLDIPLELSAPNKELKVKDLRAAFSQKTKDQKFWESVPFEGDPMTAAELKEFRELFSAPIVGL